jgi:hypothetical protein
MFLFFLKSISYLYTFKASFSLCLLSNVEFPFYQHFVKAMLKNMKAGGTNPFGNLAIEIRTHCFVLVSRVTR